VNLRTCPACGAQFLSDVSACPQCRAEYREPTATPATPVPAERGSAGGCIALGVILLAVGLSALFDPSSGGQVFGEPVVNLHKLAVGQACTVSGAVFLAAGLRPR